MQLVSDVMEQLCLASGHKANLEKSKFMACEMLQGLSAYGLQVLLPYS